MNEPFHHTEDTNTIPSVVEYFLNEKSAHVGKSIVSAGDVIQLDRTNDINRVLLQGFRTQSNET